MRPASFAERAAREVVLVQAFDGAEGPLWTAEDRTWATRLAQETAGVSGKPNDAQFIAARAHHALQRLAPRDAAVRRWLARRPWRLWWTLCALALGLVVGLLADSLGQPNLVNLLAPPVWAVIGWNLLVYAGLLVQALRPAADTPPVLRRWLLRATRSAAHAGGPAPLRAASIEWARRSAALVLVRTASVLHLCAAALGLGLIAGLYLRGLVFDIRAGWQSTFLDATTVHTVLTALLAPAVALTGIAVPDATALEALRLAPGVPATASAAPWIHLYAAMLLLGVVLPRSLLALVALLRAGSGARRMVLPLHEPYFQQLLRRQRSGGAVVQVLPHGAAPGAQAALGLRALLAAAFGADVQLQMAANTAVGDEDTPPALLSTPSASQTPVPATPPAPTLRLVLVDLGTTPEAEAHGRFIDTLRRAAPTVPLLLVADEAAFRSRFATLPERLAQRRAAWQALADSHRVGLFCASLEQPDVEANAPALLAALAL